MTDYTPDTDPHGHGGAPDEAADPSEPYTAGPSRPGEDPQAALERLQSLGPGDPAQQVRQRLPRRLWPRGAGPGGRPARPRPAAVPGTGRTIARIAAPVVFLIAVIAVISIVASSGIIGRDEPVPAPSPSPRSPRKTL